MMANPDLDQHFLIDDDAARKIVSLLDVEPDDVVLEIGPGKGALTKWIPICRKIIAVERDRELAKEMLKRKNIELIVGNGLLEIGRHRFTKLLSNTPYAIIEPLLRKMMLLDFELAVIVVGSGTAKHLREKNLLSLLSNEFFEIDECGEIDKRAFDPIPKTKSAILRIRKREKKGIIRELMLMHDKVLKNALREYFVRKDALTKREARKKADALLIPQDVLARRVDTLSFDDWMLIKRSEDAS